MSGGWREQDHPRHPAETPGGRGGEFREAGSPGGWVSAVATAIRSPEQEMHDLVLRAETVRTSDLSGGSVAHVRVYTKIDADSSRHFLVGKTYGRGGGGAVAVAKETLVARIGRALGAPVPTTIVDPGDSAGMSLFMEYIEAQSQAEIAPYDYDVTTPSGQRLGLLDLLVYNHDRHSGNWLVLDDGSYVGIDHSHVDLDWDEDSKAEQTYDQYWSGDSPFAAQFIDHTLDLTDIDAISPAEAGRIRTRLERLFERDEIRALMVTARANSDYLLARWDAIAAKATGGGQ